MDNPYNAKIGKTYVPPATVADSFLRGTPAGWVEATNAEIKTLLGLALTQTANAVGFSISGGTTSKSFTVELNSVVNQDLTTDANVTFGGIASPIGEITPNTIRGLNKGVTKIATGDLIAVDVAGTYINNYGQTNDALLTWPAIADGQGVLLRCSTTVAKYWGIKVAGGSYIWLNGTKGASGGQVTIASASEGAKLAVVAVKNTAGGYDLDATTISGVWVAA